MYKNGSTGSMGIRGSLKVGSRSRSFLKIILRYLSKMISRQRKHFTCLPTHITIKPLVSNPLTIKVLIC